MFSSEKSSTFEMKYHFQDEDTTFSDGNTPFSGMKYNLPGTKYDTFANEIQLLSSVNIDIYPRVLMKLEDENTTSTTAFPTKIQLLRTTS